MGYEEICADRKTEAAIERELGIISEAASRLGERASTLCPEVDWRAIRNFGNLLRHAYDRLDRSVLEQTLDHDLPELKPFVERALRQIQSEGKIPD